jgi:hypothetical protein
VKKYLKALSVNYWKTNVDDRKLENYIRMREHPGWDVHKEFLIFMLQQIGNEMLSATFTKKDKEEKDILQRTYHNMSEVIRFLLDPTTEGKKQGALLQHNRKIETEATKGK